MRTRILTAAFLLLASAGLLAAQNAPNTPAANLTPDRNSCLGDRDAPIVLEIFSDYQCPSCQQYFLGTIQPLLAEYVSAGTVCVIYRDLPLESIHAHARKAATYAVAAARVGQWLPVTQALYLAQEEWSKTGNIEEVLTRALPKKNFDRIQRLVKDPKVGAAIDRDLARAKQLGVRATPTSFLTANGQTQRLPGAVQYQILKRYLDHLLGR